MEIINPERDQHLIANKPPLPPPKPKFKVELPQKSPKQNHLQWKTDEENIQQIQKLNALNDKLMTDIADLRKQLHYERNAVRELRATHDGEYRKLKNETKKLLEIVGNVKKTAVNNSNKQSVEIAKLTEEIVTLKDARNLLEKKLRNCTCPSGGRFVIKSSDHRTDHITATAKAEIQKLLNELKSKEREISNLKNEIKKNHSQMHTNANDGDGEKSYRDDVAKGERFVTHVDLTTTNCHPSEDTTFKAVIKMDVPHPDNNANNNIRTSSNAATIIEVKESHSSQGQSSSECIDIRNRKTLEFLQKKYEIMKQELCESRARIDELEQSLVEQNNNFMDNDRVQDRVMYLEEREKRLEKETHELREQNELLEFRILELEENQDKWSLRSNLTPDSKDTCNCWREKETDDLMMMSSDSGITSPNSHHLDDHQSVSPCSISLMDHLPTDDMRAHITKMSKRSFYNEDDKMCFLQMIMLLNSLEALSHDHSLVGDDFSSLEYSMEKTKFAPSKIPEPVLPPALNASSPQKYQQGKIIATVQPYSTNGLRAFAEPKKDVAEFYETCIHHQETQTDADHTLKTNAELCAEIEKLNRFRKKVEESSKLNFAPTSPNISPHHAPLMSTNDDDTIEQRHLKFYQERLRMLEEKLEVYESNGDDQAKLLSNRLQKEVQLELLVKQLNECVYKLKRKNQELEENNCELEEIENETRLRWQKLEEEVEVMGQRNVEMEMSRNSYQEKYEEARDSVDYLEECLQGSEERIRVLEAQLKDLQKRLELAQFFIPAVALFQMWKAKKILSPPMIKPSVSIKMDCNEIPENHPIHKKFQQLQSREKQLTQNINDLNRAYHETLENADNLWAQMEKEYKDKIAHYERLELSLRTKIQQLEKRLLKDTDESHERIALLEENEFQLKTRANKLNRDLKEHQKQNKGLEDELNHAKEEHFKLQQYINGPVAENIEKEKRKLRRTEEDLQLVRSALLDTENAHRNEQALLKRQLQKMHKELKNFEVTNSELKEEVETLERRIMELESYRVGDKTRIQELIDEIESRQQQSSKPLPFRQINGTRSLAQELNYRPIPRQKTVIPIERSLFADAIERFENPQNEQKREIKSFTDSIISNAENNGFVPIKRSFVEEARQKFAKWV